MVAPYTQPVIPEGQQAPPEPIQLDGSVQDTSPEQQPIQLDYNTSDNYLLSNQTIQSRAFKLSYGDPKQKLTPEDASNAIQAGQEKDVREGLANDLNADLLGRRYDLTVKTVSQKQGPLSPEDYKNIDTATGYNFPYQYPVNPDGVMESNYANRYISELDNFATELGPSNPWFAVKSLPTTDAEAMRRWGTISAAHSQYWMTKYQKAQDAASSQGLFSSAADIAKIAFPMFNPYVELKTRAAGPNTSFGSGILLGEHYQNLAKNYRALPWNDFMNEVDKNVDPMIQDNPRLAMMFIEAMIGQSTDTRLLNDVNTIGNLTDFGSIVKIGSTVWSKASLARSLKQQAINAVKANVNPESTQAAIATSVGDIPTAAGLNAGEVMMRASQNPTQTGLDMLDRYFRVMKTNIAGDTSISDTRRNILLSDLDASRSRIFSTLPDMLRPTGFPIDFMDKDFLLAAVQRFKDRYAGINNNFIKISNPFLEPLSNRFMHTAWIGRNGAEFFSSAEEAAGYMDLHGFRTTMNSDQLANIDARIADLKASEAYAEHQAGINQYYKLDEQIKDLEKIRAKNARPGGYLIKNEDSGLGYYVEFTGGMKYDDRILKDFLFRPERETSVSPSSWTNWIPYFNKLRTAEDTLSAEHRQMRKPAVYPQSIMIALAHEEGQFLDNLYRGKLARDPVTGDLNPFWKRGVPIVRRFLNKEEANRFEETLAYNQRDKDPNPNVRGDGYYFETPKDLNDYYIRRYNGDTPSAAFQDAYFAVKRWQEYDRILRELGHYGHRSSLGAETHVLVAKNAAGEEIRSDAFDGWSRSSTPKNNGNMLMMGETPDQSKVIDLSSLSISARAKLDKQLAEQGGRIIELYDTNQRPFKGMGLKDGDKMITAVWPHQIETSPLKWDTIPQRGGGHLVYDYEHAIKMADIQSERVTAGKWKNRYNGDKLFHFVANRAQGEDYVKKLNAIKNLLRDGKDEDAHALFTHHQMPYDWNEFKGYFRKYKDSNGVWHEPRFDINEDFHVVPRNKLIIDMSGMRKMLEDRYKQTNLKLNIRKGLFMDGTREMNPARNHMIEFTGERDAESVSAMENLGTKDNPIWKVNPAQMVSPIDTLNRSLGRIIRSSIMDDYKTYATMSWLQEARPHLNMEEGVVDSSPYWVFKTAGKDSFSSAVDPALRSQLLANKFKIDQLVGTPSELDTLLHSAAQKLADAVYEAGGKPFKVVPPWLLHTVRDPFSFFRSVTFNAYSGLFSIPQLFVQTTTFATMWGIAPRYSTAGTLATMLHGMSRLNRNPEILARLDELASSMRLPGLPAWKPGEWLEAMKSLERTGFSHVAGEYAPLSNLQYAKVVQQGKSQFLHWGTAPFRGGEKTVRIGAWYTAFKEFRDAHPTGPIGRAALQRILDRADFLYGNMSSASNSLLHTGILSLPTQFFAYNLRLAELFFSKRMAGGLGNSASERNWARLRILAVNSLMFGVPMGLGVTGAPVGDWLRQELLDHGYKPGNNAALTTLIEGAVSAGLQRTTGHLYDFGQRYGLQGWTIMRDLISDPSFWKIAFGATGSLMANTGSNLDGFIHAMWNLAKGTPSAYPLKSTDWVDAFKEAWSVKNAYGLWVALTAGKWVNKNLATVGDVSPMNAIFMTAFGLQPQLQVDARNIGVNLKSQQDFQKFALNKAQENMERAFLAEDNKDPEQAKQYFIRAATRLQEADIPEEKIASMIAKAVKGKYSLIERIAWERYIQDAPASVRDEYRKMYGYIYDSLRKEGLMK